MTDNQIHLQLLEETSLAAYLALEVTEGQREFIETPAVSLMHKKTRAWNIDWTIACIYAGNEIIGYTMYGINEEQDVWLDRFMIDRRFQHRGYGEKALACILKMLQEKYPVRREIYLSVEIHNKIAIALYEKYGFQMTEDLDGKDPVMVWRPK